MPPFWIGLALIVALTPCAPATLKATDDLPPATQPATAPASLGTQRAEKLKAGVAAFEMNVWYIGDQDKPFYTVVLHVAPMAIKKSDPFNLYPRINEATAVKMIDLLLGEGDLDRAVDTSLAVNRKQTPTVPGFHLTVSEHLPTQTIEFDEAIGFDLRMLKKLDSLRTFLDGDAARDVDFLINRLSGWRKEWTKQQAANEG